MTVKRIVTNISAEQVERARAFYGDVLDKRVVMDQGWILTFAAETTMAPQISVAREGGSGTAVPDISIEVDNFEDVHRRVLQAGLPIEYGPVSEPWGVKRFFLRDPFGRLVNILVQDEPCQANAGRKAWPLCWFEARPEATRQLPVADGIPVEALALLVIHHPSQLGGRTGPHFVAANHLAGRQQGSGGEHAAFLDDRAVENGGADADEGAVFQDAAVDDGVVAHRDVVTDFRREAA
jgi:catechol 2,3-dioxygenase-like lactoylglutathione lyase family enzyme